jgi:hypothetical protein
VTNRFHLAWGLMALMLSNVSFATHFSGEIHNLQLSTCGTQYCFKIDSPKAYISKLNGSYAFDIAQITLLDKNTKSEQILTSHDAFYDVFQKKILIRNAGENGDQDFLFDVADQKLLKFTR